MASTDLLKKTYGRSGSTRRATALAQSPGQCTNSTPLEMVHPGGRAPELRDHRLHPEHLPTRCRGPSGFPEGFVKDIIVDTPEGLSVNPERRRSAPSHSWRTDDMPARISGRHQLPHRRRRPPRGTDMPPGQMPARRASRCRSTTWCPFNGVPSMVGFLTAAGPTFIVGSLDPGRPARHLHDQRHPPAVADQPADRRLAAGLQRESPATAPT